MNDIRRAIDDAKSFEELATLVETLTARFQNEISRLKGDLQIRIDSANLPDPAPKVEDVDISLYWINAKDYGSKTYGYREDQIQHYRLPWVLVATVRASYNADLIRKTRTSLWLTKVVSESDILNADTVHELYECAELTFALKEAVR